MFEPSYLNERLRSVLGQHLVRFGAMGMIAPMAPADGLRYARGARVVCRTWRGLELGEVLAEVADGGDLSDRAGAEHIAVAGTILRRLTVEDDLLAARLEKHKHAAFVACQDRLTELGVAAALVDVEHLFDGQSLLFYFLGETTPAIDSVADELAVTYDTRVQFRQFSEALTQGCGPGCGTADATGAGCGSGGCSTCAVASACKTR